MYLMLGEMLFCEYDFLNELNGFFCMFKWIRHLDLMNVVDLKQISYEIIVINIFNKNAYQLII